MREDYSHFFKTEIQLIYKGNEKGKERNREMTMECDYASISDTMRKKLKEANIVQVFTTDLNGRLITLQVNPYIG